MKDFNALIKIIFCSFCKLSLGVCDGLCYCTCPYEPVATGAAANRWGKGPCYGRAVLGRWAAAARPDQPTSTCWQESSISSTPQCLSASHSVGCCVSHQPDNRLWVGLAHWEPVLQGPWEHRNTKIGEQINNKEMGFCCWWSVVCFLCDPALSVCSSLNDSHPLWQWQVLRDTCKRPQEQL